MFDDVEVCHIEHDFVRTPAEAIAALALFFSKPIEENYAVVFAARRVEQWVVWCKLNIENTSYKLGGGKSGGGATMNEKMVEAAELEVL